MRQKIKVISAVLFNCIMGAVIASLLGAPAIGGAIVANLVALACAGFMPKESALAGVLTEVWTGELIKHLRRGLDGSWLDGVPDESTLVNNDVIHMVDVGIDPDVLINNDTYPIDLQELTDGDKTFSLDKFQTKVTPITDDELYAISYDKMARVKESHGNAINDAKFKKAAHAMCASENTAKTPVLTTNGAVDTTTGRVKLCMKDVIDAKRAMDKLNVPAENRRLVLCSDHINDLLETEQTFREQYNIDRGNGTVGRLYGFDIYEYANCPLYTTAGKKKAVDATADTGEFQASFAFYTPRVFKATGTTKMYYRDSVTDPQMQQSTISFRHRFICMPKKEDAGVVIASGYQKA